MLIFANPYRFPGSNGLEERIGCFGNQGSPLAENVAGKRKRSAVVVDEREFCRLRKGSAVPRVVQFPHY